jgi:hypothetical protein
MTPHKFQYLLAQLFGHDTLVTNLAEDRYTALLAQVTAVADYEIHQHSTLNTQRVGVHKVIQSNLKQCSTASSSISSRSIPAGQLRGGLVDASVFYSSDSEFCSHVYIGMMSNRIEITRDTCRVGNITGPDT